MPLPSRYNLKEHKEHVLAYELSPYLGIKLATDNRDQRSKQASNEVLGPLSAAR